MHDGRDVNRSERMQINHLCLSHERLRHELAGAESLLDLGARKISELQEEIARINGESSYTTCTETPVNHYHPHTPHSTNGSAGRYFDENGFMYAEIG